MFDNEASFFFLFKFEHNASLQCLTECKQGYSCSKHILDVCHSDGYPTLTVVGHTLKQVDLSAALAVFSPQLFSTASTFRYNY